MSKYNADILSDAFDSAIAKLESVNNKMSLLPRAVANFLIVYSAQGVIDNGGYRYFFQSDWPDNPPYARFVNAYEEIGCERQAKDLARVVDTFPFDNPHTNKDARNKYMDENYDDDKVEIKGWGDALCGDKDVWEKLKEYLRVNALSSF